MREHWHERPPSTLRRPAPADEAREIDVCHSTRVPARAHYVPLEQREPTLPPQSVFVVDQRRRSRNNRQPFPGQASSPRFARRLSPNEHHSWEQGYAQPRLAAPRPRATQNGVLAEQDEHSVPILGDEEEAPTPSRRRSRVYGTLLVALGMLGMLLLWYGGLTFFRWWQISQDDLRYGRPRTYQTDAVVGHHDSASHPSHFIALNKNGQVEIIEFPGGDPTKAKIYLGPPLLGEGSDLIPVTLSFRDVTGDGKLDMLVDIESSVIVFLNDGGQFRPLKPGEHVQV